MKTKIIALVLLVGLLFVSCAEEKTIDGVTYRPYGLLNEDTQKNPNINYEVSGWALFSGIVWVETVIVPVYVFGYNLWEPVGKKPGTPSQNGVVTDGQNKSTVDPTFPK